MSFGFNTRFGWINSNNRIGLGGPPLKQYIRQWLINNTGNVLLDKLTIVTPQPQVIGVYCLSGTNVTITAPHLTGSETVVSSDGTSTPVISVGLITFTGTLANLVISDGSIYPCQEGNGLPQDVSGNGNHATVTTGTWAQDDVGGIKSWNLEHGFTPQNTAFVTTWNCPSDGDRLVGGDFENPSDWVLDGDWAIISGVATKPAGTQADMNPVSVVTEPSGVYRFQADVVANAGTIQFNFRGYRHSVSTTGPVDVEITAGTGPTQFNVRALSDFDGSVDNISITTPVGLTIPTIGTGYDGTVQVEELDGTVVLTEDFDDASIAASGNGGVTVTPPFCGEFRIRIVGSFPRIYFNNTGDKLLITGRSNRGYVNDSSDQGEAYYGCSNLLVLDSGEGPTFAPTDLTSYARDLGITTLEITDWDLTGITTMENFLRGTTLNTDGVGGYNEMLEYLSNDTPDNIQFHGGLSAATGDGLYARDYLINDKNWTITDETN